MIGIMFSFGTDYIEVRIDGTNVYFKSTAYGGGSYPMESMTLSKAGVLKEFPELAEDAEWKSKAIERFKEHLAELKTENNKAIYIMNDLCKFGYTPIALQQAGHRIQKPRRINDKWEI